MDKGRDSMDKLRKWLQAELKALQEQELDEFNGGYYGAITNVLDYIDGGQVYIDSLDK